MEEELITHLTEEWDKEIYPCYFSQGEPASIIAKKILQKMVDKCCSIFNEAKGTRLGADLIAVQHNPENLTATSIYFIRDNSKDSFYYTISFKLPKSIEFNKNPEAFYKNIMNQLMDYLSIKATIPEVLK